MVAQWLGVCVCVCVGGFVWCTRRQPTEREKWRRRLPPDAQLVCVCDTQTVQHNKYPHGHMHTQSACSAHRNVDVGQTNRYRLRTNSTVCAYSTATIHLLDAGPKIPNDMRILGGMLPAYMYGRWLNGCVTCVGVGDLLMRPPRTETAGPLHRWHESEC